jgi:predicted AlkP superfamily pyrophosphatase or phosphodiesterase
MSNARSTSYRSKRLSTPIIQLLQQFWSFGTIKRFVVLLLAAFILTAVANSAVFSATTARPKTIVISLDGATPTLVNKYLADGAISQNEGLGPLKKKGVVAEQNITVNPSLTAPSHIAIATGSGAAANDINANSFHLVASLFNQNISGFAAPIGGYSIDGPKESSQPTANPLWLALRANGKKVVAATFPGADGADIFEPTSGKLLQSSTARTVDYTVPFGTFAGVGAKGFSLSAADFAPASAYTTEQLKSAGKASYSPILQTKTALDNFTTGTITYNIQVAALDTTRDRKINYDTLVFFDSQQGIQKGPFNLPATGSAYIQARSNTSSKFYLEGSTNKAGTSFYVSQLAPDLSQVRIARYSANFIPRNKAILADVDDINNNVGFWSPQPDFRIPERLSPGFTNFPDSELEAIYEDQVRTFVDYQTRVALRAIAQNSDADLVLTYIEQPDGSTHQFLLTDPRQATDFTNPNTIGQGQDRAKIERYQKYVQTAYYNANRAVQQIINAAGTDKRGRLKSNIIVVSDHGFAPFHTAVNLNNFLASRGFDNTKVRAVTSGPAVNIYFNLQGREPNGTVSRSEYAALQQQVVQTLSELVDNNPNYTLGNQSVPVFGKVYTRPVSTDLDDPLFGVRGNEVIGQDAGDVFATMSLGYNFDGTQNPVVQRLGDTSSNTPIFSVPNFYGAHGYDPQLPEMSAIFFAAGPNINRGTVTSVRNIDIAPTILQLLGVQPADTVQGRPINLIGN